MTIFSDDMELVGDLIQNLAQKRGISELDSRCDFQGEFQKISQLFQAVDAGNAVRQRHNADMAENAQIVKGLVVQAEDARILGDMKSLKARYDFLCTTYLDWILY